MIKFDQYMIMHDTFSNFQQNLCFMSDRQRLSEQFQSDNKLNDSTLTRS